MVTARLHYNAYYRRLNGLLRADVPGERRGFCETGSSNCVAVSELQAVGLVEARMLAIRPEMQRYDESIDAIETAFEQRSVAYNATLKALPAWVSEHKKVRQALTQETSASAAGLRAALLEMHQALITQQAAEVAGEP